MKIAIYNKRFNPEDRPVVEELFAALDQRAVEVALFAPFMRHLHSSGVKLPKFCCAFENHAEFKQCNADFALSMGGDGTILELVCLVRGTNVPMLGINLGRLGFLANVDKHGMGKALDELIAGSYSYDTRSLLHLESSPSLFGELNFALNDCTLLKRDTSSMVIIHAYLNGEFLNSYWADGLIIATPTGSTGYSLSCGGPIVFPNSNSFIVTPVAPHNLNVRPLVVSDDSVISFEIEGRARNFLCTLDARNETVEKTHQLAVRKADFQVRLVRLPERNFLSTIRDKLNWGSDIRNY
jgi:NAD+ kinase